MLFIFIPGATKLVSTIGFSRSVLTTVQIVAKSQKSRNVSHSFFPQAANCWVQALKNFWRPGELVTYTHARGFTKSFCYLNILHIELRRFCQRLRSRL